MALTMTAKTAVVAQPPGELDSILVCGWFTEVYMHSPWLTSLVLYSVFEPEKELNECNRVLWLQQPNSKTLPRSSSKNFVSSTAPGCCGLMFDAGILLRKSSHSIFVLYHREILRKAKMTCLMSWPGKQNGKPLWHRNINKVTGKGAYITATRS
jgi:hypothetical protein